MRHLSLSPFAVVAVALGSLAPSVLAAPQEPTAGATRPAEETAKLPGVGSWTQFRGDPQNSGVSHSPRPAYKGLKWKYFVGAPLSSTPAVAAGKVIAPSEAGWVNAIDAATGRRAWVTRCGTGKAGGGIIFTSPLIHDGRVYTASREGRLYCLDLETGQQIFEFDAGDRELYASPKGDDRGIVFSSMSGAIFCVDPKTGKQKWKAQALREVGATVSILGDTIFVAGKDRNLYEIDYATGAMRPKTQLPGTTHCTAALGAGFAYLVTGGRKSQAVDLLDGRVVWEDDATSDDQIATAYADGVAYFPLGAVVRAVDGPTGRRLWEFKADHKVAPPLVNGNDLVVAGRDHKLRVLDRKTGAETWSLDLGEGFVAGPVIVDGVVYLAGDANEGKHVFAVE